MDAFDVQKLPRELWGMDDHLLLPEALQNHRFGLSENDRLVAIDAWNKIVEELLRLRGEIE